MTMQLIQTEADWDMALKRSQEGVVYVFKHSGTCPVSTAAHEVVTTLITDGVITNPIYKLVVQGVEDLKMKISEDLAVKHESPQLIRIQSGSATTVWNHHDITTDILSN